MVESSGPYELWTNRLHVCFLERGATPAAGENEGYVTRKHEWDSTTKKASNRSWDKVSLDLFLPSKWV